MRALCWHGKGDVRVDTVPDPKIEDPRDAIVKVTACAICGSDLHLYDGVMPEMHKGDVLGHETMGEVVEVGPGAKHKLKVGDRVVIPFTISCGECFFCKLGPVRGLRALEPRQGEGREAVGPLAGRAVRLLAPAGRLRGRAGRVHPRALRRRRAAEGALASHRRAGPVPVGHLPDRLHGGRELQHPPGRPHRDLGLRARSACSRSAAPSCWVRSA
jgi:hypothetical protein